MSSLFEFSLKPIEAIEPWIGSDGSPTFSWYALSDGSYHMNLDGEQLYRYSDDVLGYWKASDDEPEMSESPFVDYQVSRLYEDILSLLPDALQEVPHPLSQLARQYTMVKEWIETLETNDDLSDEERALACSWYWDRNLDGLGGDPRILFLCINSDIYIMWRCDGLDVDGYRRWSARQGEYRTTKVDFISEVESFSSRFLRAMDERVERLVSDPDLCRHFGLVPSALRKENEVRQRSLDLALSMPSKAVDWEGVVEANRRAGVAL